MNIYDKIRKFCQTFRIVLGVVAILSGLYFTVEGEFYNLWFALGLAPLVAGLTNFCPLCIISKKCSIQTN